MLPWISLSLLSIAYAQKRLRETYQPFKVKTMEWAYLPFALLLEVGHWTRLNGCLTTNGEVPGLSCLTWGQSKRHLTGLNRPVRLILAAPLLVKVEGSFRPMLSFLVLSSWENSIQLSCLRLFVPNRKAQSEVAGFFTTTDTWVHATFWCFFF